MADGARKLSDEIAEYRVAKVARYAGYRVLVERALEAGSAAMLAYESVPAGYRRRGAAWVAVDDGRSSFARFLRDAGDARWKRNRELGSYLPVILPDLDEALACARAIGRVLTNGGASVTVEYRLIFSGQDDA